MDQTSKEVVLPSLCASDAITVVRAYELQNQPFETKQNHIGDLKELYRKVIHDNQSVSEVSNHLVNVARHYYIEKIIGNDPSKEVLVDAIKQMHPDPHNHKEQKLFYSHDVNICIHDKDTNELTLVMISDPLLEERRPEGGQYIMPRAMVNAKLMKEITGLDIGEIETFGITSPVLAEEVRLLPPNVSTPERLYNEVMIDDQLEVYQEKIYFAGAKHIEEVSSKANKYAKTFVYEHLEPMVSPEINDFQIDDPEFKKEFDQSNEKMLSEYAANTLLLKSIAKELAELQDSISSIPSKSEEEMIAKLKENPGAEIETDLLARLDKIKSIDGPAYKGYAKYAMKSAEEIATILSKHEINADSGNIITEEQLMHSISTESNELDSKKLQAALKESGFDLDAFKNITSSMQIRSRTKEFKEGYAGILEKQAAEQLELIRKTYPMLDAFINNEDGNNLETENAEDLGYGASPVGY